MPSTFNDGGSRMQGPHGRRGRFDCCTDCGAMLDQMGELWCPQHRPDHTTPRELAAAKGHRERLADYFHRMPGGWG